MPRAGIGTQRRSSSHAALGAIFDRFGVRKTRKVIAQRPSAAGDLRDDRVVPEARRFPSAHDGVEGGNAERFSWEWTIARRRAAPHHHLKVVASNTRSLAGW
jgi:hypothetical protein